MSEFPRAVYSSGLKQQVIAEGPHAGVGYAVVESKFDLFELMRKAPNDTFFFDVGLKDQVPAIPEFAKVEVPVTVEENDFFEDMTNGSDGSEGSDSEGVAEPAVARGRTESVRSKRR